MKLFLTNREQLQSLGAFLVSELDSMVARIRGAWSVEHKEDDTHGNVHADSLASGRVTLSDIVEETIALATLDNYDPGGLTTAGILRLNSALSEVSLTGLRAPQDELGNVLDGRLLVIENASTVTVFALEQEGTTSSPRNRFNNPWEPSTTGTSARIFLFPASLTLLSYNAKRARWMVFSRSNDEITVTTSIAANKDDFPTPLTGVPGWTASRYVKLEATAANLTVSGFNTTNIPVPSRKTITNNGGFKYAILHQSTSSAVGNRVQCPGGVRYMLHPRESVDLYRAPNGGWRIIEKADQWIDVAYSAGDYLASAGTWTVDSADLVTLCYQIDGNRMTVAFRILNTDVSATPTTLTFPIPNGRTAARTIRNLCTVIDAGTAEDFGRVEVTAGATTIAISKKGGAAFTTTAADNTSVIGEISFMVFDATAGISESHTDVAHGDTPHSDVAHSDVAHVDVAHSDSHGDASHTDAAHGDVAHVDTTSHSDVSHDDVTHVDIAHDDVAHEDTPHSDNPNTHSDTPHLDHDDLGAAEQHGDADHGDGGSYHGDAAHSDSHSDSAHSDTPHSDVAHSDSSSHSDTPHSDSPHVDGGHSDSHADTAPHSDTAHVDVAHSDTAHADNAHEDVGLHTDSAHSDI
jgi:hypothetical protein